MKVKVEYVDSTHKVYVSSPCKWCKKLTCICDDEYEQHVARNLQNESNAVAEAMYALKNWND